MQNQKNSQLIEQIACNWVNIPLVCLYPWKILEVAAILNGKEVPQTAISHCFDQGSNLVSDAGIRHLNFCWNWPLWSNAGEPSWPVADLFLCPKNVPTERQFAFEP